MIIDPRLLKDGEVIGKFKLCHVLLMRDANYPWCVLVPDRDDISEIFELSEDDQKQLSYESNTLLACLKTAFNADKMNVAALGNVVSQLHIHHIVRYKDDIAWPAPIWGAHPAKAYSENDFSQRIEKLIDSFSLLNLDFKPSGRTGE